MRKDISDKVRWDIHSGVAKAIAEKYGVSDEFPHMWDLHAIRQRVWENVK